MPPHATDCPGGAAMRQPSAPPWEVADIFRLYGATYRRTHPVLPSHQKVMHDIEAYRTAQLGGPAEHCPTCGFERYAYNSCRNRHCTKCQTFTRVQWVEDRKAALLPVLYFHLVLTRATRPPPPHPGPQEAPIDPPVQRRQSNTRPVWVPQPRRADRVHHSLAHLGPDLRGAFPCPLRHRRRGAGR